MRLHLLLVAGVCKDNYGNLIIAEGELVQVLDVAFALAHAAEGVRHFDKERLLDPHPERPASLLHHLETLVGPVVVCLRVDKAPLIFTQVGGLRVGNLTIGVLFPVPLASVRVQHGLMKDFALDVVALCIDFDVELTELASFADLVDDF